MAKGEVLSAAPNADSIGRLDERMRAVERHAERMDNRIGALESVTPSIDRQKDTESRLRSVEALRWQLIGAAALFALVGSLLGPLLKFLVTGR